MGFLNSVRCFKEFVLHCGPLREPWKVLHLLLSFDKSLKLFESDPKQKKMTLAKRPSTSALQDANVPQPPNCLGTFRWKALCVCTVLSCWVIFFNNWFLALHYCTMKILLYYTFFRESTALRAACRVGLLAANFQSHAFCGKCILNHAASH